MYQFFKKHVKNRLTPRMTLFISDAVLCLLAAKDALDQNDSNSKYLSYSFILHFIKTLQSLTGERGLNEVALVLDSITGYKALASGTQAILSGDDLTKDLVNFIAATYSALTRMDIMDEEGYKPQ